MWRSWWEASWSSRISTWPCPPGWWGALLGLGALSVILVVADLGALLASGPGSPAFLAVNNGLMVVVVVGVANLWAQSGMKARDAAVLAGALTIYDAIFTTQLPLMTELFSRLADLPFGRCSPGRSVRTVAGWGSALATCCS